MEDRKILLGKVGEWFWSKFYFDKESNCFIEEKYHEENLDTGTIFDGESIVLPQKIYADFVEELNFDGITALLKCVDNQPLIGTSEGESAKFTFLQQIDSIDQTLKKHLQIVNDTYIIRNKHGKIIGVLFSNEPFYAYRGLYKPCKGFVSKSDAFSYAIECLRDCYTPRTILINNRPSIVPQTPADDPNENGLTKYENIESILSTQKPASADRQTSVDFD